MSEIKAVKFVITGRVQGVGFRWFVLNEAKRLNIYGTVKNLVDGSVEVFAQAPVDQIYRLKELLKKGSSFARVENVFETPEILNEHIKEFKVTY